MTSNSSVTIHPGGGIGFGGALTLLFIALKLTGVIDWSWIWVLSPLWIGLAITVVVVLIAIIIFAIIAWASD